MGTEHQSPEPRRVDSAVAALLEPGGRLGDRYELGVVIGRGGMAEVRDGWDTKLGRPVAIKLLHPSIDRPENRVRFETEARAAAALSSTHIVVVHDIGEHRGVPFIVMERLPGVSLADHIARGPLPPAFVHGVLDSVLTALADAHQAGILHRDVKPGNILFTAAGDAKLADFGIAKTTGGAHTMTGHVVGTMAYLSPDRLIGKPATPADDLYAVGVVGYEALTGRRPFPEESLAVLSHAILHETPAPITALRPDVHPGLAAVIARAMTREPAERFYQAGAMRAALNRPDPVRQSRRTRVMEAPPIPVPDGTYSYVDDDAEPDQPWRKLWIAAVISLLILALMLMAFNPFAAQSPSPATTSTPLPTPTTTIEPPAVTETTTVEVPQQGPQKGPPQGPPQKGPKGPKKPKD
ncbi:serine/threonine protein kinase [Mycobacterium intermedium]|nr:serine/threonine protein kinase [Mycobacterium intermedium]